MVAITAAFILTLISAGEPAPSVAAAPIPVLAVSPEYPKTAALAKVEGVIKVTAAVSSDGHVVVKSQVPRIAMLEKSVLEALSRWKFTNAPADSEVVLTVSFKVQTLGCGEPLEGRTSYAIFRPPYEVEVWGFSALTCDPVVTMPARRR